MFDEYIYVDFGKKGYYSTIRGRSIGGLVGCNPVKIADQKEENLMGVGGISIWQLLIVLVIVLLLFGTKKLRNMGGDLGGAIKGFRSSMKEVKGGDSDSDSEDPETADQQAEASQDDLADVEATEDVKTEKV